MAHSKDIAGIGNPYTMTGQRPQKGNVDLSHGDWLAFDQAMNRARNRFSESHVELDWYSECVGPALEEAGFRISRIE
jgi:hypothetical protein